jgi:hypothetical protein
MRARIEQMIDGLSSGRVLTLIRYREVDHAVHSFEFQLYRSEEPQYRLIERFESGVVQEEFMDIAAIAVLCNWLLYLKFEVNLYSPYTKNSEEN